jgi:hypothetical protein
MEFVTFCVEYNLFSSCYSNIFSGYVKLHLSNMLLIISIFTLKILNVNRHFLPSLKIFN